MADWLTLKGIEKSFGSAVKALKATVGGRVDYGRAGEGEAVIGDWGLGIGDWGLWLGSV